MKPLDKLSWNTQIINTETGMPNDFFILLWQTLLSKVESIDLPENPSDGAVLTLTYSEAQRKWIGS